jgi:hypothetical protein
VTGPRQIGHTDTFDLHCAHKHLCPHGTIATCECCSKHQTQMPESTSGLSAFSVAFSEMSVVFSAFTLYLCCNFALAIA